MGGVTLSDIGPTPTFIEHLTVVRNVSTPCLSARHLDTLDYVFLLKNCRFNYFINLIFFNYFNKFWRLGLCFDRHWQNYFSKILGITGLINWIN